MKTWICLILDASGSMEDVTLQVREGWAKFIELQKTISTECFVSIYTFNDSVNRKAMTVPLDKVTNLSYYPGGGTALYDAIGVATSEALDKMSQLKPSDRPNEMIFIIATDGQENRSCYWKQDQVKERITTLEKEYGWHFLYVGANQNAYTVGKNLGIQAGKALSFAASASGMDHAFEAMAGAVLRYRQSGTPHANQFFTDEDHDLQAALGASRSVSHS